VLDILNAGRAGNIKTQKSSQQRSKPLYNEPSKQAAASKWAGRAQQPIKVLNVADNSAVDLEDSQTGLSSQAFQIQVEDDSQAAVLHKSQNSGSQRGKKIVKKKKGAKPSDSVDH